MVIRGGGFAAFVLKSEQIRDDEKLWEIWLHKDYSGRSFNDFKASLPTSTGIIKPTEKQLESTVKESYDILRNFHPEG